MHSITKVLLLLIVVLMAAILIAWFFMSQPNQQSTDPTNSATRALDSLYEGASDDTFAEGLRLERSGDSEAAIAAYQETLGSVDNVIEEAHVRYRIARTIDDHDPVRAVELFKEIIANPDYPDVQKKYAAMWLPILISKTGTEEVKAAVLSGEPYGSFADETMITVYKNLN